MQRVQKFRAVCCRPCAAVTRALSIDGPDGQGHRRVQLVDQIVELGAGLQQLRATVMRGGVDGGQDAQGAVVAVAAGGVEDVAQLADGGLESTVGRLVSSLITSPPWMAGASPLSTSSTLDTAKTLLGTTRGHGPRDVLGVLALQVDVDEVGLAECGGRHRGGRTDQQPVVADVGRDGRPSPTFFMAAVTRV